MPIRPTEMNGVSVSLGEKLAGRRLVPLSLLLSLLPEGKERDGECGRRRGVTEGVQLETAPSRARRPQNVTEGERERA